jgi:YD repeat-containing protein
VFILASQNPFMKRLIYVLFLIFTFISNFVSAQKGSNKSKLKGVFYQYYEKSMSAWQGMDSVAYVYDSLDRKFEEIHFMGDSKPLFQSDKKAYSYDSFGRVHIIQDYMWNPNQSTWDLMGRSTNSYNGSDSLLSIVSEELLSITWRNNSKWEYTYDANDNKTSEQLFLWDTLQNNWTSANGQKTTFSFDGNNRLITENRFTWDNTNNVLRPSSQRFFSYAGNTNSPGLIVGQMWDGVSSWHNSVKDSILYDSKGLKTEEYGFYFNEVNATGWDITYRYLYHYSNNNKLDKSTLYYFDTKQLQFTLGDQSRVWDFQYTPAGDLRAIYGGWYDTVQKKYIAYDETFFYYQNIQTLHLFSNDWRTECELFPNPFNQHIRLKCDDLEAPFEITIYTVEGEVLKHEVVLSKNELMDIDTRYLKNGVYFIQVHNEDGQQKMTKMIKF